MADDQDCNGESAGMEETPAVCVAGEDSSAEDDRKMFVGGLSWETTEEELNAYFSDYGHVLSCTLKTDQFTHRSRGFGFVLFATMDSVKKVIAKDEHKLHGRTIDPKMANPRGKEEPIKKVYVGRLDAAIPEEDIRAYFSTFGKIEKLDLPFDKMKDERKRFCFVEFDSETAVNNLCDDETAKHVIAGKEVEVKKAVPLKGSDRGRGFGRGRGRGGRGRGGYDQWGGYQGGPSYGQGGYGNYYNQGNYGYGQNYGNYGGGGYDYDSYNQNYGAWSGYDQNYGSYGGYGGYDYSGWGSSQDGGGQGGYGKADKRGGGGYHPYSR